MSLLIAPTLDGAADSPALVDSGAVGLAGTTRLSLTGCERLDNGLAHLRYAALPG